MMKKNNLLDYIIPIIIFLVIIICIYYFKKNSIRNDIKQFGDNASDFLKFGRTNKEDFTKDTINLSNYNAQIQGNLFSGFKSREEADSQIDIVKNIIKSNPSTFNNVNIESENIYLNGSHPTVIPYVKKICLGNIDVVDNNNICIDNTIINKFDDKTKSIPNFRNANDKIVYYNEDSKSSNHNKLCFIDSELKTKQEVEKDKAATTAAGAAATTAAATDTTAGGGGRMSDKPQQPSLPEEYQGETNGRRCITAQHFNMINGNNGTRLKYVEPEILPKKCEIIENVGFFGNDLPPNKMEEGTTNPITANNAEDCADYCEANEHCKYFSFVESTRKCWLKNDKNGMQYNNQITSGKCPYPKYKKPELDIEKIDSKKQYINDIQPYLVEYGERKGFSNVVKRVFYLPETNYYKLRKELIGTNGEGYAQTCYGAGGRQWHVVDPPFGEAAKWAGDFYLIPQPVENANYSHIHDHTSTPDNDIEVVNYPELVGPNIAGKKNLDECIGECDRDSDCKPGLKCFQRSYGEPIPGCRGPGGGREWDYCYDPIKMF